MSPSVLSLPQSGVRPERVPTECRKRWSTREDFGNQYYGNQYDVVCVGVEGKSSVCDARTCHMGGKAGNPIDNPYNKQLFFDKCAKINHEGKEISKPIFRIFPRSFTANENAKSLGECAVSLLRETVQWLTDQSNEKKIP